MKCARLNLQERTKVKIKTDPPSTTPIPKARRYCQKRLINPQHEEDPRWMDIWDRFHCNLDREERGETTELSQSQQDAEEIVLTVQTLKFQGDVDQSIRPRTSFKYKNITHGKKHRMFVKQVIPENEYDEEDTSSLLTHYYFDDYVKYLYNSDRSRPTSSKSSTLLKDDTIDLVEDKAFKGNKSTQVEIQPIQDDKRAEPEENKEPKRNVKGVKEEQNELTTTVDNTKITYLNTGRRKSLTISRTESPETLQVIRVDVVCNQHSNSISEYDEKSKLEASPGRLASKHENFNIKNHFASKYLLTNSVRTLDESLFGGSKVTLLCKTFRLTDRLARQYDKPYVGKKRQTHKDITRSNIKLKNSK